MKTLVAFSAGVDSTFLLWKLLTETDDTVHAFLIDFSEIKYDEPTRDFYENLAAVERIAAPRVIDWLTNNIREVTFQVVTSGMAKEPQGYPKSANSRAWRVLPMLNAAASLMAGFDRFVYGKTQENRRSLDYLAREQWDQRYWRSIAPANTTFEIPLIEAGIGRPKALALLPADLQALMISCDRPTLQNGEPTLCGKCSKCAMTTDARAMLTQGVTPETILDFQLRKRRAGPYTGLAAGDRRYGG